MARHSNNNPNKVTTVETNSKEGEVMVNNSKDTVEEEEAEELMERMVENRMKRHRKVLTYLFVRLCHINLIITAKKVMHSFDKLIGKIKGNE